MPTNVPDMDINTATLKRCREQMGLSLEQVEKHIRTIATIEQGLKKPTFKQMDTLEELYEVPRWVFIADKLPERYHYNSSPSFRQYKNASIFDNSIRKLIVRIEDYRKLILELREDLGEPIPEFSPPPSIDKNPEQAATTIRQWLGLQKPLEFSEVKNLVEQKNIFVFMTSKHKGWAHIDKQFRGLCIHHTTLPIIIINDSDARKAQSFTMIHELGHLLKKKTSIDEWTDDNNNEEEWCNDIAAATLMPDIKECPSNLADIKKAARKMKVSNYAFLVRSHKLDKINYDKYKLLEKELYSEYEQPRKQTRKKAVQQVASEPTGNNIRTRILKIPRIPKIDKNHIAKVKNQYGSIMINTVLDAYHSDNLGLHRVGQLLGLKTTKQVLELEQADAKP